MFASISANEYKAGDRIVLNAGTPRKPEFYLATITTVRKGKWYIRYDDDDKGTIDNAKDIVGLAKKRRYTKSFGKDKLDSYLVKRESAPRKKDSSKVFTGHITHKQTSRKVGQPKKVRLEKAPTSSDSREAIEKFNRSSLKPAKKILIREGFKEVWRVAHNARRDAIAIRDHRKNKKGLVWIDKANVMDIKEATKMDIVRDEVLKAPNHMDDARLTSRRQRRS